MLRARTDRPTNEEVAEEGGGVGPGGAGAGASQLQRPLFITPTYTPKKSSYTCRQIHWNLVPDRGKSCFIMVTN